MYNINSTLKINKVTTMLNFLFFVEKLCELCKLWDKIQRNVLLGEI